VATRVAVVGVVMITVSSIRNTIIRCLCTHYYTSQIGGQMDVTNGLVAQLSTEHRVGCVLTFQRDDADRFTVYAIMKDTKCREKFCVMIGVGQQGAKDAHAWMRCIGHRRILDMTIRNASFLVNAQEVDDIDADSAWADEGFEEYMKAPYGFNQGSPLKRKYSKGSFWYLSLSCCTCKCITCLL
jgi:hypothetical protein